jgi:integrase
MICYVFRHKRKTDGRVQIRRLYSGRYKLNGEPKATTVPLFTTDKQQAKQKLLEIVQEREKELAGIRGRKAWREAAQIPVLEHLKEFVADLRARMRSESHIKHLDARIKRLFVECRWEHVRDVSADSFQLWRANQREFSQKTLHEYQNAASSFFVWMERNDRLESNPLRKVGKVERKGFETVHRRAFSDEEMQRLLAVAGTYALGYLAAVNTGLRRKELASVQWGDVHLDAAAPFILVRNATTKNRKAAKIYIKKSLARLLADIKPATVAADEPVFAGRIAPMRKMHEHLKAAGIPVLDEQGNKVDFHALRVTFSTNLELVGASLQIRQGALRHCDPRLTAGPYTDTTRLETASQIEKLPEFITEKSDDTQLGTHATISASLAVSSAVIINGGNEDSKAIENKGDCHALADGVTACHTNQSGTVLGFESPSLRHFNLRFTADVIRRSSAIRTTYTTFRASYSGCARKHYQSYRVISGKDPPNSAQNSHAVCSGRDLMHGFQ